VEAGRRRRRQQHRRRRRRRRYTRARGLCVRVRARLERLERAILLLYHCRRAVRTSAVIITIIQMQCGTTTVLRE